MFDEEGILSLCKEGIIFFNKVQKLFLKKEHLFQQGTQKNSDLSFIIVKKEDFF